MNDRPPIHPRLTPYRFRDTDAELGILRVPLHHAAPGGTGLELRFVRLPSRAARSGPPIVFLTGGPGLSGIRAGEGRLFPMFDALRAHSDIILLDQRACVPGAVLRDRVAPAGGEASFPNDRAVGREEYLRVIRRTVHDETTYLGLHGIRINALNTRESADDVAMLARALYGDNACIALLAWSYGSHLAMALMKQHASLVSHAVLAGPEGPDHTFKRPVRIEEHLERLAGRASFDFLGSIARVLGRLETRPERITVPGNLSAAHTSAVFGRFDLAWTISELLADPRALRRLPVWLARMEQGDFGGFASERLLSSAWLALREDLPHDVGRFAMDCASGAGAERRAMIEIEARSTLLGNTIDFPLPDICEAVGCPDLGDDFRAAPRSDVPVLFITGTLDCRTPAENVADLAPGLSNHQHLVVEDAGHGDLLLASAVQRAINGFLRDEPLAASTVQADVPLVFETR